MHAKLFPRLTYANVTSTFALFLALGGSAYAATRLPANSVGAGQIKTGAVGARQLQSRAVTSAKIALGAVGGANVARNSLTGLQIDAATLGTVPNATHALSADTATNATHASAADTATNASHASTADTATNAAHSVTADTATDATELGGIPAANYLTGSGVAAVSVAADATLISSHGGATVGVARVGTGYYAGTYCIGLPFTPAGGAVSLDSNDAGFPVAFTSFAPATVAAACGSGYQAVISTFDRTGGVNTNEAFSAIFY